MFYGGVAFSQDSYASFGVVAEAPTVVNLTGLSATAGLGTVSVSIAGAGSVSFTVAGVAGTSALGNAESVVITPVNVTGVSATGVLGTAIVEFNAFASATGVLGTGAVGAPVVYGIIDDSQTPIWTDIPT
tara:strand:- start:46 stop:435 length:390 start_codon:yes stop_codon:yes gene_type:complete